MFQVKRIKDLETILKNETLKEAQTQMANQVCFLPP